MEDGEPASDKILKFDAVYELGKSLKMKILITMTRLLSK